MHHYAYNPPLQLASRGGVSPVIFSFTKMLMDRLSSHFLPAARHRTLVYFEQLLQLLSLIIWTSWCWFLWSNLLRCVWQGCSVPLVDDSLIIEIPFSATVLGEACWASCDKAWCLVLHALLTAPNVTVIGRYTQFDSQTSSLLVYWARVRDQSLSRRYAKRISWTKTA